MTEPIADPRQSRNDLMRRVVRIPFLACLVLATIGTIGADATSLESRLAVAVIVIAPLARVCWLIKRWFGRGDVRYGLAGILLLVVITLGTISATL